MDKISYFLLVAPALLFAMVAHEYAHGWAALRQGDPTAYQLGRLTWNPIKHIDPFLTILMPLMMGLLSNWKFMLGAAKPVHILTPTSTVRRLVNMTALAAVDAASLRQA